MHYELWDVASRNMLDDFATEAEALTALAALLAINEPDMGGDLTLIRVGGPNGGTTVASGAELARRAQTVGTARSRLPAKRSR